MKDLFESVKYEIQFFLQELGVELSEGSLEKLFYVLSVLLTLVVIPLLKKIKIWKILRINSLNKSSFYSANEIKRALDHFVQTKFQNTNPSEELEPSNTHAFSARRRLLPFFFRVFKHPEKFHQKYYLILADSGMGKTTFMLNLYFRYRSKLFRKFDIKIFPLGQPGVEKEILGIPDEKKINSILLLDALDEDKEAVDNYIKRINRLMDVSQKFRFVIVSCRTQFFPMQSVEPTEIQLPKYGTEGGFHEFKKIFISPFSERDIRQYLFKRYPVWRVKRIRKAYNLVKVCPYLMVRPMLLSYVDDLIENNPDVSSISDIYEKLIASWVQRETIRQKPADRGKFEFSLNKFSREFAMILFERFKSGYPLSIHFSRIEELPNFGLSNLELKSKSLLNRDTEGNYKFSHKSILEYFLAVKAYNDQFFLKEFDFKSFSFAREVYLDLCKNKIDSSSYTVELKDKQVRKVRPNTNDAITIQNLVGFRSSVLDLSGLGITDDYLMFLSPSSNILTTLSLENNIISDVSVILEFKGLTQLNLANNRIKYLNMKGLDSLEYLDLSNNDIEELSIELPKLKELNLQKNPLSGAYIENCGSLKLINVRETSLPHTFGNRFDAVVYRDNDISQFVKLLERHGKTLKDYVKTSIELEIDLTLNAFNRIMRSVGKLYFYYRGSEKEKRNSNYDLRHDYVDGINKPHLLKIFDIAPLFTGFIVDEHRIIFEEYLSDLEENVVSSLKSKRQFRLNDVPFGFITFCIVGGCLCLVFSNSSSIRNQTLNV